MKYKIFSKKALFSILVTFMSVLLFNFIIDPYHTFNVFTIKGINTTKNNTVNHTMSKFHTAKLANPTVLLIGTSRTAHIHPLYLQKYFPDETIYNLAIPGSGVSSQKNNIEYFIKHHNVKTIIYGLDFFAFNPINNRFETKDKRYKNDFTKDYMDSLLSVRTLRKSIKTLKDNIKNRDALLDYPIGWETYTSYYNEINKRGDVFIKENIQNELNSLATQKNHFNYPPFKEPTSIKNSLDALKEIVKICKDNNVELHMFISPVYSQIIDLIYERKYDINYAYWKRELSKYETIHDFSGYNSITQNISNYIDGSHYQTKLAAIMFAKIFNDKFINVPDDFGTILKTDTIDSTLEKQAKKANTNVTK